MSENIVSAVISIATGITVTLIATIIPWAIRQFQRRKEIHDVRDFLRDWKTEIQQVQGIQDDDAGIQVSRWETRFVVHEWKMKEFRTLLLFQYRHLTNQQTYELLNALDKAEVLVNFLHENKSPPAGNFYWQQFEHFENIIPIRSNFGVL